MSRFLLACLLSLLGAGTVMAQGAAGSLAGQINDPDGKPVERLETAVTLTNPATGAKVAGRMDKSGKYLIDKVPAGTYDLEVIIPSRLFERYQRANVVVNAGQQTRLDFRVEWGMNLGTIGDDPLLQAADLRSKTKDIDGPVPRTADGKPDLSGVWINMGDAITPPPMPMKPWAQELHDKWREVKQDNPGAYCLPQTGLISLANYPYKLVQTPQVIVQMIEDTVPGFRQIHMDGRKHPGEEEWNPSWWGHSIGHWDGDTLVVDTQGFNEKTPGFGIHTEKLHLVERYTRLSRGRMRLELTIMDEEAFTKPLTRVIDIALVEGTEIIEYVCAEGNQSHASQRAPWRHRP
jgi:Carboxypeptidase regulatory-like domain